MDSRWWDPLWIRAFRSRSITCFFLLAVRGRLLKEKNIFASFVANTSGSPSSVILPTFQAAGTKENQQHQHISCWLKNELYKIFRYSSSVAWKNNFRGINRACLKSSAERKDLHPSAIRYSGRETPEGCGIFACKGGFQAVLKLIVLFSNMLELFHWDTRVGNTVAGFQDITALGYLKIDCQILFLALVI